MPVKRGASDRAAIKTALQMLEAKECICMFPEGTRSKDGKLHKGAPGVALIAAKSKAYMEATVRQAELDGFVETIFGRKRYLKAELDSPNAMIREFAKRAAINQPMQGTAADLIKIAMIDFSKKLKENNLKSKSSCSSGVR